MGVDDGFDNNGGGVTNEPVKTPERPKGRTKKRAPYKPYLSPKQKLQMKSRRGGKKNINEGNSK